jgi:hypothetical protein
MPLGVGAAVVCSWVLVLATRHVHIGTACQSKTSILTHAARIAAETMVEYRIVIAYQTVKHL